jgi:hypothetical protein
MAGEGRYRTGNRNARNIYRIMDDGVEQHVGCMFTEADGREVVASLNGPERQAAPIDWPARFRAAADVVRGYGWGDLPRALETMAAAGSSEEVEAIGRALLGEVPPR